MRPAPREARRARRVRGSAALRALFVVVALACIATLVLRGLRRAEPAPAAVGGGLAGPAGLASDDRIGYLLAKCPRDEHFLEDTSDMLPVLVAQLAAGQLDPLRQAKAELARLGATALPELGRLFEAHYGAPHASPVLQNVLAVAALMPGGVGRGLLLRGLEHPQESVRTVAIRGLVAHARPEDYDALAALLPISIAEFKPEIGEALFAADRVRLEDDFVRWFEEDEHPSLLVALAPKIADTTRPETLAGFRRIYERSVPDIRMYIQAASARAGDAAARAELTSLLEGGSPAQRTLAIQALQATGEIAPLAAVLRADADEDARVVAAEAIAQSPRSAETDAWLTSGIADPERSVRLTCLDALVARGVAAAEDEVLEMLKGDRVDLEDALRILRAVWSERTDLAERALDILLELRAAETTALRVEPLSLDRAIAQVPLERATRTLYERALSTPGEVQGVRAHRWYLTQAGNTGPQGWAFLRERWEEEADPARRVDIVMACAYDHGDSARAFLERVVDSERSTPLEVVYAADLLVHKGPASRVAPLLKRVALRVSDPVARPALDCLLWRWYGRGAG